MNKILLGFKIGIFLGNISLHLDGRLGYSHMVASSLFFAKSFFDAGPECATILILFCPHMAWMLWPLVVLMLVVIICTKHVYDWTEPHEPSDEEEGDGFT